MAMSMIFDSAKPSTMYCPKCREMPPNNVKEDEDIECVKCKMIYRRSISRILPSTLTAGHISDEVEPQQIEAVSDRTSTKLKRKRPVDEDEEMVPFRRVRINTSIVLSDWASRFVGSKVITQPPSPTAVHMQDRQEPEVPSSYWSIPDQTDFLDLLRHFGTDWHGIASFMRSKTHVMV